MQSSMRMHTRPDLGGHMIACSSRPYPACSTGGMAARAFRGTAPCSQAWRACTRSRRHVQVHCMRDDASEVDAVPDSLPVAAPGADWRAFRARLIAANKAEAATSAFAPATTTTPATPASTPAADLPDHWAHELPWPEKGCVLVAHPSLFVDRQTYFQQAVILLLDHGPNGSYGVILNKPTQYTMGQIKSSVAQLLSSFAGNRLYMGGDVGETAMAVVTRRPGILGSTEVAAGLYHHTVHAAQQAVEQGLAAPSDFRFFAQYAGWAPGQLARECQSGVWFCAAASPSLVLDEGLAAGKELWHRVLEIMGGDHARVSQLVREVERGMRRKDPAPSPPQQQQQQQQQSPPAPQAQSQQQQQQQQQPPAVQQNGVAAKPQVQQAKDIPQPPADRPAAASSSSSAPATGAPAAPLSPPVSSNGRAASPAAPANGAAATSSSSSSSSPARMNSNGSGAASSSSSTPTGPAAAAPTAAVQQQQPGPCASSSRPPAGSSGGSSTRANNPSSSSSSSSSSSGGNGVQQPGEEGGPAAA